jgi:hypothetical protein
MFGMTVDKYCDDLFIQNLGTTTASGPKADRLLPLIAAAGPMGMNRKQIGSAVDLDRDTLDQLLAGLVNIGLLTVMWEYDVPLYRMGIVGGY